MLMAGSAPMAAVASISEANPMARQLTMSPGVYDIIPLNYTIHEPPPLLDGKLFEHIKLIKSLLRINIF
jgi:hypothetical protein